MTYNHLSDTQSLYLHWPFCPYKCHFCPFVALASHDRFMEQYHQALCKEIEFFATQYQGTRVLKTIFLGGGTPSTYPPELLLDMFATLRKLFVVDEDCEISIEVNPGTVNAEKLTTWKRAGINRLSIGVQSLNDTVLKGLNRHQTAQDVVQLIDDAQSLFENISIDLILGLPEISKQEWQQLVKRIVTWPIKHVSVYFLTVHEDTPLYFKVTSNRVTLPSDAYMIELYHWTVQTLAQAGFEQYELSNFSRRGYQSKHNTVYWERLPYKAFGLGACSFDGKMRFANEKNLTNYMQKIERGESPVVFSEELTSEQKHLEKLMLGLRRQVGVPISEAVQDLPKSKISSFMQVVGKLEQEKLLSNKDGRLSLTAAGLVLENEIISQLTS